MSSTVWVILLISSIALSSGITYWISNSNNRDEGVISFTCTIASNFTINEYNNYTETIEARSEFNFSVIQLTWLLYTFTNESYTDLINNETEITKEEIALCEDLYAYSYQMNTWIAPFYLTEYMEILDYEESDFLNDTLISSLVGESYTARYSERIFFDFFEIGIVKINYTDNTTDEESYDFNLSEIPEEFIEVLNVSTYVDTTIVLLELDVYYNNPLNEWDYDILAKFEINGVRAEFYLPY